MARRSPRAVRAQSYIPLDKPVEGLTNRANAEIAQLQHLQPEIDVRVALRSYRQMARRSGRWVVLAEHSYCCPEDNVLDQRQILERVMGRLSSPSRRELRKLVAPLDEEFYGRILPEG